MIPQDFLEEFDLVRFQLAAGGVFDQLFDGIRLAGGVEAERRGKGRVVGIPDLLFPYDFTPRGLSRRRDI
jgi:hypothetical protein